MHHINACLVSVLTYERLTRETSALPVWVSYTWCEFVRPWDYLFSRSLKPQTTPLFWGLL